MNTVKLQLFAVTDDFKKFCQEHDIRIIRVYPDATIFMIAELDSEDPMNFYKLGHWMGEQQLKEEHDLE